ncbi:hypothetical protein ACVWWN_004627 [Mycobacterium sp. URHB0021]|jgi:hypothetical protein
MVGKSERHVEPPSAFIVRRRPMFAFRLGLSIGCRIST